MRQSKLFSKTLKEVSQEEKSLNAQLLLRGGFIDKLMGGVYTFLPLGFLVLKKIEEIIREEMRAIGAQEILMPVLHPKENWQKTGRWRSFNVLFKLKGKDKKEYVLGPTHEEVLVPLAKKFVFTWKDLPVAVFQIQDKFRDELRVKGGLLRGKEFIMKDLYSMHPDQKSLEQFYKKVIKAYFKIFKRCGIKEKTYLTLASGGTFSRYSHEFQTVCPFGEDLIFICQKCNLAINRDIKPKIKKCPNCGSKKFKRGKATEVGNIFQLGTKYSLPFDFKFKTREGREKPVVMGCYGIGLGRLMAAIVETNHDALGIIWPLEVAPFHIHLITLKSGKKKIDQKIQKEGEKTYQVLQKAGFEVLYDDRKEKSAGEKFVDADLIGIPFRVVISENTLKKNSIEIKKRSAKRPQLIKKPSLIKFFHQYVK